MACMAVEYAGSCTCKAVSSSQRDTARRGPIGAPQKTFHAGPTPQCPPKALSRVPIRALAITQTHLLQSALLARLSPLALSILLCRTLYSTHISAATLGLQSFTGCSIVSARSAKAAPQPSFCQPSLCVCQLQTTPARIMLACTAVTLHIIG